MMKNIQAAATATATATTTTNDNNNNSNLFVCRNLTARRPITKLAQYK
jgi:hypothetical protein